MVTCELLTAAQSVSPGRHSDDNEITRSHALINQPTRGRLVQSERDSCLPGGIVARRGGIAGPCRQHQSVREAGCDAKEIIKESQVWSVQVSVAWEFNVHIAGEVARITRLCVSQNTEWLHSRCPVNTEEGH